jgi:hypothetical protein
LPPTTFRFREAEAQRCRYVLATRGDGSVAEALPQGATGGRRGRVAGSGDEYCRVVGSQLVMPENKDQIRTLIEQWAEAVHAGDMDGVLADQDLRFRRPRLRAKIWL